MQPNMELARVLLVDDDPASRLTLATILKAGGYRVDSAASAAEGCSKLDEGVYELVLSDLRLESPEAGYRVISHARTKHYKPATALVTATYKSQFQKRCEPRREAVLVEPEDVPGLLQRIADLIGRRAFRQMRRQLREPAMSQI